MNKVLMSSKSMNWCTPPDFFEALDREFHFTLDPAATEKSAKCANYFTPSDDGLSKDWGGHRVFCNPPYGRHINDWVRKSYEESRKTDTVVVMLIPSRTDTQYWHDYIFNGKADEVRFIEGRLKFTDEDGNAKDAAPFPSAVVIWRSPDLVSKSTVYTTMKWRHHHEQDDKRDTQSELLRSTTENKGAQPSGS